ncbi:7-cyano-7-deazaguanine synthase [Actinacidiphila glaucinigra]|uniref:7-cyano-7-deazaguanine synthase n=1 Tax=Actinacidiphila glaucinigra TaxID=235986 RepID=UPI00325008FC
MRIALTVLAADRSVLRAGGGSNWNQRHFELEIPVSDPEPWTATAEALEKVLAFLSGDKWALTFTAQSKDQPPAPTVTNPVPPTRVVLLSGGADSALGALQSRRLLGDGEHHVLLSHFSNTMLPPIQRHIAADIERLAPRRGQQHRIVRLARGRHRIDGTAYPSETTTRSRSFLFIALGLAVASIHRVPLWIPENGFASINPPLGFERLGSLSTRTTHPAFLQDLSTAVSAAGAHADIHNPFAQLTKGQMFRDAADVLGAEEASAFLSSTHSCGLTGQRAHRIPPARQCGICFGCVLRRASFTAAGVADRTDYIAPSTAAVDRDHG